MTAIKILILSFLVPREFTVILGGMALSAYRLVLIALVPYLLLEMYRKGRSIHWNSCDLLALMVGFWPAISFTINTGFAKAVEAGGVLGLELIVPYMLVRLSVNNYDERKQLATLLCLLTGALVLMGLPEAIAGRHYVHELAGAITGQFFETSPEVRFGIWRALGPTDHAIIFGTICASSLATAVILTVRQPIYLLAAIASLGGAVISASSAPILVVLAQSAMLAWSWIFKTRWKWLWLLITVVILYVLVDLASNRDPLRVMFTYLLLNPATGYARYEMWANSLVISSQTLTGFLAGYGHDDTVYDVVESVYMQNLMKRTVDSLWLVFLFRHGIIMLFLMGVFLFLIFKRVLKHTITLAERKDRRLMLGFFISAFAMTLIASTVHYWSMSACIYMLILAVCVGRTPRPLVSRSFTAFTHTLSRADAG